MQHFTLNDLNFNLSTEDQHLLAIMSGVDTLTFYLDGIKVGSSGGNTVQAQTKSLVMLPESMFEVWLKVDQDPHFTGDTVLSAIAKTQNIVL